MDNEIKENSFNELSELIPGLEGIEALTALLEMPDEDFSHMKNIVLEELEKGFNNSNDKYNLALAFNMSGLSAGELRQTFNEVIVKIDEEFTQYNEEKRNFLKQVLILMINSLETGKGLHNRIIRIPIELCHEDAHIPTYAHDGDAGCDIYSVEECTIEPGETKIVSTGLKVAIPAGYELQIRPRSGMSAKTKIRIANAPGTIKVA